VRPYLVCSKIILRHKKINFLLGQAQVTLLTKYAVHLSPKGEHNIEKLDTSKPEQKRVDRIASKL
jgi:hypothetical protein